MKWSVIIGVMIMLILASNLALDVIVHWDVVYDFIEWNICCRR